MPKPENRLFYPNSFARTTMQAIAEQTSEVVLNAVLRRAGLEQFVDNLPPENAKQAFAFDDYAALLDALEAELGTRGAQAVEAQIGRAIWEELLHDSSREWGSLFFLHTPTPEGRVEVLLDALAYTLNRYSDQESYVQAQPDHYLFVITRCPFCHARQNGKMRCHVMRALLQDALRYASAPSAIAWRSSGRDYTVEPVACIAAGDEQGWIVILK